FSSRRRHTRFSRDWSSDVCSSDLALFGPACGPVRLGGCRVVGKTVLPSTTGGTTCQQQGYGHERAHIADEPGAGKGFVTSAHIRSEERRVGREWRSWVRRSAWRVE